MSSPEPAPSIDALFACAGVHVVTHACHADAALVTALEPEEFEAVRKAIASRQQEFAGGRASAHASLSALGISAQPLVAAADRSPIWPHGAVGSITHTQGYCFASASADEKVSIGLDVEQVGRVTDEVARIALSETERQWVQRSEAPDVAATTVFAAKEALYKAQHPVTGDWLGFDDVDVTETDTQGVLRLSFVSEADARPHIAWPVEARWMRLEPDSDIQLVAAAVVVNPTSRWASRPLGSPE